MKKIGITGGIGSGKSVVCRLFALLGIPVFDADGSARQLMQTNIDLKDKLTNSFGHIYNSDGTLNRKLLAGKVFQNPAELLKLNGLVHPYVIADYQKWEEQQNADFGIRESAILFESGTDAGLDYIITVTAPEKIRMQRITKRDQRTTEQIQQIMMNQIPEDEKISRSDFVIVNDEKQAVLPQVWQLYEAFSHAG